MANDRDYGRDNRSSTWSQDDRYRQQGSGGGGDDRGFFDRAGDEVRSWFGDEDAERRRDRDDRQNQGGGQDRSRSYGSDRTSTSRYAAGQGGMDGGGWQSGQRGREQDNDHSDRPRYAETGISGSHYERSWGDDQDNDRSRGGMGGVGRSSQGQQGQGRPSYGQSGGQQQRGASFGGFGGQQGQQHDPNYSRWREQQMSALDRDYHEYHSEKQAQFDQEFGSWRQKRQGQRQSMSRVTEHMEVIGSDGQHVGTVDKVRGDRIILTKNDQAAGGHHHSIPCSWIESVDERVTISKSSDEAKRVWRDEENRQALFHENDQRDEGPHMLNRSFSGTYER